MVKFARNCDPLYRHQTYRFKRPVIQTTPISLHNLSYDFAVSIARNMLPYLTIGE